VKSRFLKLIAGFCMSLALMDLSTLSVYTFYQPEIPEELK